MKSKTNVSVVFMQLCLLFAVALIASNLFETKQIAAGPINITGGMLTFPVCYIIGDLVCEVWGFRRATLLIWAGFLMNFIFVAVAALVDVLPGAAYWTNDAGFHAVFGMSARISAASFIAFLCGSFINARVLSCLKVKHAGKKLAKRLVLSSVVGEAVDSAIFFPIAFLGVLGGMELLDQMLFQFILKTAYEIIFLPITIRFIRSIKKAEQEDAFDNDINYGIFEIFIHAHE